MPGYPDSPELDVAFALNTAGTDASKTFQAIIDSLSSIINKFNPEKLRYSIITFGESAIADISFSEDPQDVKQLTKVLEKLPQPSGLPDLKKLLEKAKKVLEDASGRSRANKVLVVVTDAKSPTTSLEIKEAVKPLMEGGVTVVAVGFGEEADSRQLEKMTTDKQSVLKLNKETDPEKVGNAIMKAVTEGWLVQYQPPRVAMVGNMKKKAKIILKNRKSSVKPLLPL